jgi:hypothetical protein
LSWKPPSLGNFYPVKAQYVHAPHNLRIQPALQQVTALLETNGRNAGWRVDAKCIMPCGVGWLQWRLQGHLNLPRTAAAAHSCIQWQHIRDQKCEVSDGSNSILLTCAILIGPIRFRLKWMPDKYREGGDEMVDDDSFTRLQVVLLVVHSALKRNLLDRNGPACAVGNFGAGLKSV